MMGALKGAGRPAPSQGRIHVNSIHRDTQGHLPEEFKSHLRGLFFKWEQYYGYCDPGLGYSLYMVECNAPNRIYVGGTSREPIYRAKEHAGLGGMHPPARFVQRHGFCRFWLLGSLDVKKEVGEELESLVVRNIRRHFKMFYVSGGDEHIF